MLLILFHCIMLNDHCSKPWNSCNLCYSSFHSILMVTFNVCESVYVWGDCIWVFGYLGLFLGSFMGLWVGFMSVRVLQGVLRVFGVSMGVSLRV